MVYLYLISKLEGIMKKRVVIFCLCTLFIITGCADKRDKMELNPEERDNSTNDTDTLGEADSLGPFKLEYTDQHKTTNESDCDEKNIYFMKQEKNTSVLCKVPVDEPDKKPEKLKKFSENLSSDITSYYNYLLLRDINNRVMKIHKETLELSPLLPTDKDYVYYKKYKFTSDKYIAEVKQDSASESPSYEKYLVDLTPLEKDAPPIIEKMEQGTAEITYVFGIEFKHLKPNEKGAFIKGTLVFNGAEVNDVIKYLVTNNYVFYVKRDDNYSTESNLKYTLWRCDLNGNDDKQILIMDDNDLGDLRFVNYDKENIFFYHTPKVPRKDKEGTTLKDLYKMKFDGTDLKLINHEGIQDNYQWDLYGKFLYQHRYDRDNEKTSFYRMTVEGENWIEIDQLI